MGHRRGRAGAGGKRPHGHGAGPTLPAPRPHPWETKLCSHFYPDADVHPIAKAPTPPDVPKNSPDATRTNGRVSWAQGRPACTWRRGHVTFGPWEA